MTSIVNDLPVRHPTSSREALLARVPALVAEIGKGASQRDLDRELPHDAFRLLGNPA